MNQKFYFLQSKFKRNVAAVNLIRVNEIYKTDEMDPTNGKKSPGIRFYFDAENYQCWIYPDEKKRNSEFNEIMKIQNNLD